MFFKGSTGVVNVGSSACLIDSPKINNCQEILFSNKNYTTMLANLIYFIQTIFTITLVYIIGLYVLKSPEFKKVLVMT